MRENVRTDGFQNGESDGRTDRDPGGHHHTIIHPRSMLLFNFEYRKHAVSYSFPHYSTTRADVLSRHLAYYFVSMHCRSSSSVVIFR